MAKHGSKNLSPLSGGSESHSLNKVCNNQGKRNFPTFKVQQSILLEKSSNNYPKEFQTNSQLKAFKKPLMWTSKRIRILDIPNVGIFSEIENKNISNI